MKEHCVTAQRLPIFRLARPGVDVNGVQSLVRALLGTETHTLKEDDERIAFRAGTKVVEFYRGSGGVWMSDQAERWNPDLAPHLPDPRQGRAIADKLVREHRLLPDTAPPFSVEPGTIGGTHAAILDARKKVRTTRQLDVQVSYAMGVSVLADDGSTAVRVPMVGGGGEFTVTLGDGGRLIGFDGVWRPLEVVGFDAEAIPPAEADDRFRKLMSGLDVRSFTSYLAYYAAPASREQEFLYPVYVYRAIAEIGHQVVPLRIVTLPATTFGPPLAEPVPQPRRTSRTAVSKPTVIPGRRGLTSLAAARASNPFEAGTSWIGLSGGLGGSQNNAKGFVDGLADDGWLVNFNWGDGNAWESDWRRNDDTWVDRADFVFYTGHANMNGWVLSNPDDGFLDFAEVGSSPASPGDLWGQQDLEWVIVAACGPLQDELLAAGGGDVFDRWRGAFDGLHLLMGYAGITFDNEEEGDLVVKYARDGESLINAWFRAAKEVQPSTNGAGAPDGPTIYAGVMYVYRSGTTSPFNDHLWGHGSVAPDPTSPNIYVAMWTTT